LAERLEADGLGPLSVSAHSTGALIAQEVASPEEGARFVEAAWRALEKPVEREEPALKRVEALRLAARQRSGAPSSYDECLGRLGAEGRAPLEARFASDDVEAVRRGAFGRERVGLAALGDRPLLDAVRGAHQESWPEGTPLSDDYEPGEVVTTSTSPGGREVGVALRVPSATLALGAARLLREPKHPLGARLASLPGGFEAQPVELTLRARGACLALDLRQRPGATPASATQLAAAALVAQSELESALEAGARGDDAGRFLLAPEQAVDAASLGAWTSLRKRGEPGALRSVLEFRAPSSDASAPTQAALAAALEQTAAAWARHELPWRSETEKGQAESWLLVASPCGTAGESESEAGFRALTVRSLAAAFSGEEGVVLEPWYTTDAVGLLAHGPISDDEAPEHYAARLGRVLAQAFAGPPLDGRDVAEVRDRQLRELGENPARALMISLLAGGQPSRLEARGSTLAVAEASSTELERIRALLVQEPLRAAFLDNSGSSGGRAAARTLSTWLAPARSRVMACAEPPPLAARPGTWTLGTAAELPATRFVGVIMPGEREAERAWAWLLNRPGGYLQSALLSPGLVANAEAQAYGGGGLVVALAGGPDQLAGAERQVRALLDELAKSGPKPGDADLAATEQARLDADDASTPRGRVVRAWYGRAPVPVDADLLRKAAGAFSASRHSVVRLEPRK
jgi:hypothetical protein